MIQIPTAQDLAAAGISAAEIAYSQKELGRRPADLEKRLEMIGFKGLGTVVDAGCGIGHWSVAASQLNTNVKGFDPNPERLRIARVIAERNGSRNVKFREGSLEKPPFDPGSADAVLMYGVLMYAAPLTSLKAMIKLLKPGGLLYVTGLGMGWLLLDHVPEALHTGNWRMLYSCARMTLRTISRRSGLTPNLDGTAFTRGGVSRILKDLGMDVLGSGDEGHIGSNGSPLPFYQGRYNGLEGFFEVLARKP